MLVTLFTRALVSISAPGPPLAPRTNAKIRLPTPEQYGMTKVPSTVPSTPLLFMRSSRQIIRKEPTMNRPTNHKGAHPVLSIHVINGTERIVPAVKSRKKKGEKLVMPDTANTKQVGRVTPCAPTIRGTTAARTE